MKSELSLVRVRCGVRNFVGPVAFNQLNVRGAYTGVPFDTAPATYLLRTSPIGMLIHNYVTWIVFNKEYSSIYCYIRFLKKEDRKLKHLRSLCILLSYFKVCNNFDSSKTRKMISNWISCWFIVQFSDNFKQKAEPSFHKIIYFILF